MGADKITIGPDDVATIRVGEVVAVGTAATTRAGTVLARAIEEAMSLAVVDASDSGISLTTHPEQVRALMLEYRRRVTAGEGRLARDEIRAFLAIA